MLAQALKEWAVICRALATGRQTVLLRKGGIAETAGSFRVEHNRFWLYPTYEHQDRDRIVSDALPLFMQSQEERPTPGMVRLSHFAQVEGVYQLQNLASAIQAAAFQILTASVVQARFTYKQPGLVLLVVRVFRAEKPIEIRETPNYAGCKSWVALQTGQSTGAASPVLGEEESRDRERQLSRALKPAALT